MPHSRLGTQQQRNVGALTAKSAASASRLNLFGAIWRHSTTSTGCLCSIGILSQSKLLLSTVLLNCQPPASTYTPCHGVAAIQATGSTYADIFLCNIPRILCASQSRAPTLAKVRTLWTADAVGGPQPRSSLHRAVPEGVGEEMST
jgi:hypothetical protein